MPIKAAYWKYIKAQTTHKIYKYQFILFLDDSWPMVYVVAMGSYGSQFAVQTSKTIKYDIGLALRQHLKYEQFHLNRKTR